MLYLSQTSNMQPSDSVLMPDKAPDMARRMSIAALSEADGSSPIFSSRTMRKNSFVAAPTFPRTPPDSTAGSPALKSCDFTAMSCGSPPHSSLPPIQEPTATRKASVESLPSIQEFDQQIQDFISKHGPAPSSSSSSPTDARPAITLNHVPSRPACLKFYGSPPIDYHSLPQASYQHPHDHEYIMPLSPEAEGRHINQKYTTEQGDYIIYAWHEKKMKWAAIKEEFASMFGRTPERTVQGLQAWYYRMNKEIPVWDDDGWLTFDDDEAIEPKYVSIKRRERDVKCESCLLAQGHSKLKKATDSSWKTDGCQCKQLGPLGLIERYPERLVHYPWVDAESKRKARSWASKRTMQYNDRRERRKRKELRRVKL